MFLDFFSFIIEILLFVLLLYMFFRLIHILYKKGLLFDDDIFFITSTPWEYKKCKEEQSKKECLDKVEDRGIDI